MTDSKYIQLIVSPDLHRQIKLEATKADTTIQSWIKEAIAEKANRDKGKR